MLNSIYILDIDYDFKINMNDLNYKNIEITRFIFLMHVVWTTYLFIFLYYTGVQEILIKTKNNMFVLI